VGNARPSVTKKQREQKKRERQVIKAEKRAQRKLAPPTSEFEEQHIEDSNDQPAE
jgi:hypothetical protein